MSNTEVQMYLQKTGMAIGLLKDIPVDGLLHEFSMNDTLGPLFDPTGWMAIRNNSRRNERVVRALGVFMAEVRAAWPEAFDRVGSEE
jgi:hypothetical protein